MTVETHIVAREGAMKNGEHVSTKLTAVAIDLESGLSGEGIDTTEAKAIKAAEKHLAERLGWLAEHNEYLAYAAAGGILNKTDWRKTRG